MKTWRVDCAALQAGMLLSTVHRLQLKGWAAEMLPTNLCLQNFKLSMLEEVEQSEISIKKFLSMGEHERCDPLLLLLDDIQKVR